MKMIAICENVAPSLSLLNEQRKTSSLPTVLARFEWIYQCDTGTVVWLTLPLIIGVCTWMCVRVYSAETEWDFTNIVFSYIEMVFCVPEGVSWVWIFALSVMFFNCCRHFYI